MTVDQMISNSDRGSEECMRGGPDLPHPTEVALSRRAALRSAVAGSALAAMPWSTASAATLPAVPKVPFAVIASKDGIKNAFGEVRIGKVGDAALPVRVLALGGLAELNAYGRSAFVRVGSDERLLTLTSEGVAFGKGAKPTPWSATTIQSLVDAIAKDRNRTRGVMLLRSALHTAYPVALKELKTAPGKGAMPVGAMLANRAKSMGSNPGVSCTTKTFTETIVSTVTETVEVWKSAEKQYQECYDKELAKGGCKDLGIAAGLCAATICAAKAFIDMLVSTYELIHTVVEEVVRVVVICVLPPRGVWPNPWDIPNPLDGKLGLAQPQVGFKPDDVGKALDLLKGLTGFLGPFGKCLIGGNWSLAQLDTKIDIGGKLLIPYGVKVCVSASCARSMAITNVFGELSSSWGTALGVLAALSAEFAAFAGPLGIAANEVAAGLVVAAGGVGSVVVQIAAIILAFVILALIYGTAISAQLAIMDALTDNFADGVVCIEHPTFALALIKMATLGVAASELIPPIVTG